MNKKKLKVSVRRMRIHGYKKDVHRWVGVYGQRDCPGLCPGLYSYDENGNRKEK